MPSAAYSFAIACAIVAGDRISKLAIQHSLSIFDSIPVIAGWLRIIHTENSGAAFGILAEGNPILRSAGKLYCARSSSRYQATETAGHAVIVFPPGCELA